MLFALLQGTYSGSGYAADYLRKRASLLHTFTPYLSPCVLATIMGRGFCISMETSL